MNKDTRNKIEISIIIIIIFVFLVIIGISYRKSTYTQTWLVCDSNKNEYEDKLKFRYDSRDNLYGFYREQTIKTALDQNYEKFMEERSKYESSLDDNFTYEVIKNDDSVVVKNYIGVSVYSKLFTSYFKDRGIRADSKIDDVETILTNAGFTCEITRG